MSMMLGLVNANFRQGAEQGVAYSGSAVSEAWWDDTAATWAWDSTNNDFMRSKLPVPEANALSFQRASVAYKKNANGSWSSVAVNTMRIESDGIRLEKAATNRLLRSNDMMVAPWTLQGTATRETTTIPAPAYGNYFRINRNAETDILLYQQTTTFTVGADTCASIFFRGEGSNIGKRCAIEIKRQSGGSYVGQSVHITLTGEDQRIPCTFKPAADNTAISIVIKTSSSGGTRADSILVACPQMEDGLFPSSPIETAATAVTRAADQLTLKLPASSDLSVNYAEAFAPIKATTLNYRGLSYAIHSSLVSPWTIGRKYETSDVIDFEVRPGDVWVQVDPADKERSEMVTGVHYAKNVSVWNAHAFKLGAGFTASTNPGAWFIIGQWHGDNDSDGRSPYIALNLIGDAFVITRRYFNGTGQTSAIEMYRQENFPREEWYNIVIEHKVVDATNGIMNVWLAKDGQPMVQIVSFTGPVGYWDHPNGGYWKFGIYRQAASFTGKISYQNNDEGTASLISRVTTPLPLNLGKQTLYSATPVSGDYVVDTSILNHQLVKLTVGSTLSPFLNGFGVNLSGPEFAPWNGQTWPVAADFVYLAAQGVKYVRLPFAWESMQPTLNGALATTYLNGLKTAIALAWTNGIKTIVDLHNFGYYVAQAQWTTTVGYAGNAHNSGTGVNIIGDGTLTTAHLVDFWTKLATELKNTPGIMGYGLMNEPGSGLPGVNMLKIPNYFAPPGSFPWASANGGIATQLAVGTNPLGAGYGPAWQLHSGTGAGFGKVIQNVAVTAVPHALSVYAWTNSGTSNLRLHIGALASTHTVTTTPTRFTLTGTPTAGTQDVGIQVNLGINNSFNIANSQLELGSAATAYVPNVWYDHAQAGINAIRTVDAATPIYVAGSNFGQSDRWSRENYEMARLTGGNLVFEAHQYFDGAQGIGGGGAYAGSYASYSINNQSGVEAFEKFNSWCKTTKVEGFIGEFGIPNDSNWIALQVEFAKAVKAARMRGTQWFYGSNGAKSSNILNIMSPGDQRLLTMLSA